MNSNFKNIALKSVIIDFIFTFLPLFVLILIRILTSRCDNIFSGSDFSFITMILFGQAIIKLFAGVSENENRKQTHELLLHISLIIFFGLVPSIVILVLIEIGYENKILSIFQVVWMFASAGAYLFFGTIGNILAQNKIIKESDLTPDEKAES